MKQTLGTQLRHLIELLDGAVQDAYVVIGLDYRPRYTPVMRALIADEPLTIGEIAERAGLTQPAVTQTVALMAKQGLVRVTVGKKDARCKIVSLSPFARQLVPELELCWRATASAAQSLEAELPHSLTDTLALTISALKNTPFGDRIQSARVGLQRKQDKPRRSSLSKPSPGSGTSGRSRKKKAS